MSYYNNNNCNSCGNHVNMCTCGSGMYAHAHYNVKTQTVKTVEQYVRKAKRRENGRIDLIHANNDILSFYEGKIANIYSTGENVVLETISGDVFTMQTDPGVSHKEMVDTLKDYVTNQELEIELMKLDNKFDNYATKALLEEFRANCCFKSCEYYNKEVIDEKISNLQNQINELMEIINGL